jgi:uncharacterized protein (DUF983 family)
MGSVVTLQPGDRSLFVRRVVRKRCPQCGEGPLFRRFARLHEKCERCELVFRRESGAQTGSMYLTAAVSEVFAAAVALALFFLAPWSPAVEISLGVAFVVAFSYAFLPLAIALWTAVEYTVDVSNGEKWVAPRR